MNTCKLTRLNWLLLSIAWALPGLIVSSRADTVTWNGGAGDLLWSSPMNWSVNAPPWAADAVVFSSAGATNTQGAVNNIVTSSLTISNLTYTSLANNGLYHTTLIQPGQTLTVDHLSTNSSSHLLDVEGSLGTDDQIYATIVGANASLVLGNPALPQPNHLMYVSVKSANIGLHRATLDLSALDNFTFAGGFIAVGGDGGTSTANRPAGTLLLAKTNLITANRAASTTGTIRISHNSSGNDTGAAENVVELGQENTINTIYLRIGGEKALNGGAMRFRSGLVNPTLKLRGTNGVDAMSLLTMGDNWDTATGVKSTGVLDLSGGTVDGLIETMHVGRTFNNGSSTTSSGSGDGTLTFTAGTIDAATVYLGCQGRNNLGVGTGLINVRDSATLAAGTLNIANDRGTQLGTGNGTLNIDGGTVTVSGNILENDASAVSGTDGSSTIHITNNGVLNLQPPGDLTPGNITVDTLNFSSGTLTNYGTLGLSTINLLSPATDFTVHSGQALTPVGTGNNPVGTLAVNGNLVLSNATLHYDLDPLGVSDQINVSGTLTLGETNLVDINVVNGSLQSGSYLLATYGTALVGNANNLQMAGPVATSRNTFAFDTSVSPLVSLTVGAVAPLGLTWAGDGLANIWDVNNATNWNGNTEKFYTFDTVTFDDTGSTMPAVSLVGALMPLGVTVNSVNNYTFSGPGWISGATGLTNLGTGTLFLQTSNDYTGTTMISAGTVVVGDGGTNGRVLPPIINDGALVFNRSDEFFYSGAISGSGSLAQIGSGGLRLNVVATYAGPTTVENGWLRISSGNNRLPTGTVLTLGSAGAMGKFYMGITTAAYSQQLAGLASAGLGGSVVNGGHSDVTDPIYSTLTLNTTNDYVFAGRLGGDNTNENNLVLVKSGAGKQTLTGVNTYTNTTTISGGTLALSGSGSIASSPIITVSGGGSFDVSGVTGGFVLAGGQTLMGDGTVIGPVTVAAGATLSPGTSFGTLTISNDLILSAGSTHFVEVNTDTLAHDLVTGLNQVTYGGTLLISPSGTGSAITNGTAVKLFHAATYTGAFAQIVPAVPAPGLVWDPTGLTVDGTLKVVGEASPAPTNLTFAVVGNALDISWPADQGWRLEGQTNSINVGLNTNWSTVPGSTDTNHMILPIEPANGTVFYRLAYP